MSTPAINFLPWREQHRQRLRRKFVIALTVVILIAVALLAAAHVMLKRAIDHQQQRNTYLQQHIDVLDQQQAEVAMLIAQRDLLIEEITALQTLQVKGWFILPILTELVTTLPDGVVYQQVNKRQDTIDVVGNAENHQQITQLIRQIDASRWFTQPMLTVISAEQGTDNSLHTFQLSFSVTDGMSRVPAD